MILLIEVADTSLSHHIGVKEPLYTRHRIPPFWVIDAATRRAHVFWRPMDDPAGSGYAETRVIEADEPLPTVLTDGTAIEVSGSGRSEVSIARLLPATA